MLARAFAAIAGSSPPPPALHVTAVRTPAMIAMPLHYVRRVCACGCGTTAILCTRCYREIHECTCRASA